MSPFVSPAHGPYAPRREAPGGGVPDVVGDVVAARHVEALAAFGGCAGVEAVTEGQDGILALAGVGGVALAAGLPLLVGAQQAGIDDRFAEATARGNVLGARAMAALAADVQVDVVEIRDKGVVVPRHGHAGAVAAGARPGEGAALKEPVVSVVPGELGGPVARLGG